MTQFSYNLDENTKWVEYDEYVEKPIQVEIRYLDDDMHQKMMNKSKTTVFVKHQKEYEFSTEKLRKQLINVVVVNMKAKVKDLQRLVVPKVKLNFEGDPEKDLVFNNDVKELLAQFAHSDFCNFLTIQARELQDFINAEKEKETENLKPGSGSKEVPKDSPRNK
ncbi:MAG: hypothetical protein JSV88_25595 [Candidatus Aminicenantes bacterium]|nr:MAG: hypothetical protein JSV88_25595 [Candidatus Aminicenantes bacterium]